MPPSFLPHILSFAEAITAHWLADGPALADCKKEESQKGVRGTGSPGGSGQSPAYFPKSQPVAPPASNVPCFLRGSKRVWPPGIRSPSAGMALRVDCT